MLEYTVLYNSDLYMAYLLRTQDTITHIVRIFHIH